MEKIWLVSEWWRVWCWRNEVRWGSQKNNEQNPRTNSASTQWMTPLLIERNFFFLSFHVTGTVDWGQTKGGDSEIETRTGKRYTIGSFSSSQSGAGDNIRVRPDYQECVIYDVKTKSDRVMTQFCFWVFDELSEVEKVISPH